jgi:hypothetical protein
MVDAYPTPIFYDLNADGLLDIVCGSQAGRLTYLENTGTQSQAYYSLKTNFLGAVDVTDPENPYYGYSVPAIFSYQSDTLLNVAAADGAIRCYGGLTANDGAVFTLFQPMLGQLDVGERCGAAIAYLDDDAWPDLLCGNLAGGYELFMGTQASAIGFDDCNDLSFSVCPNPNQGSFSLMACGSLIGKYRLRLVDIIGKAVFEETLDAGFNQAHYSLNLHPGMYIVSLTNFSGKSHYAKMLVIE